MKERPIIFSTPMVQAIIQGRKTMTRRVIKPQPDNIIDARKSSHVIFALPAEFEINESRTIICPYGQPGDRLWVRETWTWERVTSREDTCAIGRFRYKSNNDEFGPTKWKPSIFMPRKASRILLEITNVKVERLQDINVFDIVKEGVSPDIATDHPKGVYYSAFMSLWQSIGGKDSWLQNPWVWVIEFKVLEVTQ